MRIIVSIWTELRGWEIITKGFTKQFFRFNDCIIYFDGLFIIVNRFDRILFVELFQSFLVPNRTGSGSEWCHWIAFTFLN